MIIFPSGKGVSITREFLQPTEEMPVEPSLLTLPVRRYLVPTPSTKGGGGGGGG